MANYRYSSFSLVLLMIGAGLLACSWLLPNHTNPWTSFHSDALAAMVLSVVALVIFARKEWNSKWYGLTVMAGCLTALPLVQYAIGFYAFSGQAWISSVYIFGFFLALLTGEKYQLTQVGDFIFLAVGSASLISIGLQFQQWLGYSGAETLDVWVATRAFGLRPYANMGQANQLATLLLWGMLACGWGIWRGVIRNQAVVALIGLFIFSGLALTQSRSGALGVIALVIASWCWRSLWKNSKFPFYFTALAALYGVVVMAMPRITEALLLDAPAAMINRLDGELRPTMWCMFYDAALTRPWLGFGWSEVLPAQILVADLYPFLGHPYFHSHNLFLDFVLWAGIPIGAGIAILFSYWLLIAMRRVKNVPQAIFFLMIMVIAIHAMLELPLHYAYFLLPIGVVAGALNVELGIWSLKKRPTKYDRWILLGLGFAGLCVLGVIVRDYLEVEESYGSLQLERSGIVGAQSAKLPDVWILNQLREAQRFMKYEPMAGVSAEQMKWAEHMVAIVPSPRSFMTYAVLLGLNGRGSEAQTWLIKMCRIVDYSQCQLGPERWALAQRAHPELAGIAWPANADPKAAVEARKGQAAVVIGP